MSLLAALGLLSIGMGVASLSDLVASYRQSDIAVTETPQTFQVWLGQASATEDATSADLAARVALRLLAMPLEKRRDISVALLQPKFWLPLAPERQTPRALHEIVRDGVVEALQHAPMAGDLYLVAASLEIRTQGYRSRARAMLKASHLFSARELPLVIERLAIAPTIWPLLLPEERARLKTDLDTLRDVAPARADKIEAALAAAGVTFP